MQTMGLEADPGNSEKQPQASYWSQILASDPSADSVPSGAIIVPQEDSPPHSPQELKKEWQEWRGHQRFWHLHIIFIGVIVIALTWLLSMAYNHWYTLDKNETSAGSPLTCAVSSDLKLQADDGSATPISTGGTVAVGCPLYTQQELLNVLRLRYGGNLRLYADSCVKPSRLSSECEDTFEAVFNLLKGRAYVYSTPNSIISSYNSFVRVEPNPQHTCRYEIINTDPSATGCHSLLLVHEGYVKAQNVQGELQERHLHAGQYLCCYPKTLSDIMDLDANSAAGTSPSDASAATEEGPLTGETADTISQEEASLEAAAAPDAWSSWNNNWSDPDCAPAPPHI